MTITAHTRTGASCGVHVIYPSGSQSRAGSIRSEKKAGSSGTVSWSLTIGTKTTGKGAVTVSCTLGSSSGTGTTTYSVR